MEVAPDPCACLIVAQNGREGFNVAGSPSWDRFLCALPGAGVRMSGMYRGGDMCKAKAAVATLDALALGWRDAFRPIVQSAIFTGNAPDPGERLYPHVRDLCGLRSGAAKPVGG